MNVYVNGRKMAWETYLKNGVFYISFNKTGIPIKDFFDYAGFKVEWDNDKKVVRVTDENFKKPSGNV